MASPPLPPTAPPHTYFDITIGSKPTGWILFSLSQADFLLCRISIAALMLLMFAWATSRKNNGTGMDNLVDTGTMNNLDTLLDNLDTRMDNLEASLRRVEHCAIFVVILPSVHSHY
jgi:hypothetical protein